MYNRKIRFGENAEWLVRAKEAGIPYHILPESLVTLRLHGNNQTNNLDEMRSSILIILKESMTRKRAAGK